MERGTLLALLVCPACREPLAPGAGTLDCRACGADYAIEAGVPILLEAGERERLDRIRDSWGGERLTGPGSSRLLGVLRRLVPPPAPFLNLVSARNLARLRGELGRLAHRPLLLDLGSGRGEGAGIARLGPELLGERMVRLDVDRFAGVDVVALGARLPFAGQIFDAVLLKSVLEHVPEAAAVLAEAHRVLRPGGLIYVELPFLFEYHPNPLDYLRWTRAGLERALGDFTAVEVGALVGPFAAVSSLTAHALALLLSGRSRLLRKGLLPYCTWLAWPLSLPDLVVLRHPAAHFVAHHLYGFGRKPGGAAGPASGSGS